MSAISAPLRAQPDRPPARRRSRLWVAVALLVLMVATACGSGSQGARNGKPAELRIGYQSIPNGDLIVKHNRWLEEQVGVPVRWLRFSSGAAVNQALGNHTIDVGLAGTSSVANGVPAGVGYKVAWVFDVIGSAEALVVRQDAGVDSLAGLAGKKVAVPFGSTTHYALLAALTDADIDPVKVTIVDLEPEQIVAAWKSRAIDAAYIWQPSLNAIVSDGGTVLLDSAKLAEQGVITGDLGVVSDELVSNFPDVVTEWVKQQDRAVQQIKDDPSKAVGAIAAELGISADQAKQEMNGYRYLTAREQVGDAYLGTKKDPGQLVSQLTSTATFLADFPQTAKFLKEPKLYEPKVTEDMFRPVVDPSFAAKVAQ